MHRPVGGSVGDIAEERGIGMILRVFLDVANHVVGDRVGVEPGSLGAIVRIVVRRDVGVVPGQGIRIEEGTRAVDRAVEAIEAPLERPVRLVGVLFLSAVGSHVPLAAEVGPVSGGPECLGDGEALSVEITPVGGQAVVAHHVTDPGLVRIEPGQEGRPGRAASSRIVELGESKTAASERIEARCRDFTPVAPDVGVAHVIRHDENDVGALGRGEGQGKGDEKQKKRAGHGGRVESVSVRGKAGFAESDAGWSVGREGGQEMPGKPGRRVDFRRPCQYARPSHWARNPS